MNVITEHRFVLEMAVLSEHRFVLEMNVNHSIDLYWR